MLDRINLVPKKPFSEKIKRITPLAVILVLSVISFSIYHRGNLLDRETARLQHELQNMEQELDQYNALLAQNVRDRAEAGRLSQQNAALKVQIDQMESFHIHKRKFSNLISDIALATPASIVCNKISFTRATGEITGIAKGYEELPEFIEKLKNSEQINEVTLKAINRESATGKPVFDFHIMAQLQEIMEPQAD